MGSHCCCHAQEQSKYSGILGWGSTHSFTVHSRTDDHDILGMRVPGGCAGKVMSKCGKCSRYMRLISARPSRLYCGTCEEVFDMPQVCPGL